MLFGPMEKSTVRPVVKEKLGPGDFARACPYLQPWKVEGVDRYWKNPRTGVIEPRPPENEIPLRR